MYFTLKNLLRMCYILKKPLLVITGAYLDTHTEQLHIETSRDFDAKASSRRIENDCIIINIKKYQFNIKKRGTIC
jgi:hypothetical protein